MTRHPSEPSAPLIRPRRRAHTLALVGLIAGILLVALALANWQGGPATQTVAPSAPPMHTAVYVWQRLWTDEVDRAVRRIARRDVTLMILAAELISSRDGLDYAAAVVHWPAVAATGRPAWLVVRAGGDLARRLADPHDTSAAQLTALAARQALAAARDAGVRVAGLQVDYDCPTARLGDYRRLLDELAAALPGVPLAVTALPTWLGSDDLPPLVRGLDHVVLQAHALERPETVNDPVTLIDPAAALRWTRQAADLDTDYYVALPAYGYELLFDAGGRFVGVAAEGPPPSAPAGYRIGVAMPEPETMAGLVRRLRENRPERCRGVAWFRLGLPGDRLAWPPETLERVLDGLPPEVAFGVEARSPEPQLLEIWIRNTGQAWPRGRIALEIILPEGSDVTASDAVGGFSELRTDGGRRIRLSGPPPRPSDELLAAWFRLAAPLEEPVVTTQVEVVRE